MFVWDDFIQALKQASVEFEHLKVIQLAQAILESGRGKSDLFKLHGNPYGMKFRKEMRAIADQVTYTDSAGETDIYCKFDDVEEAVKGYWAFIDRPVYSGWRTSNHTPEDYIEFIAYAGYIGGPFDGSDNDRKSKDAYIKKILDLVPEAKTLLGVSSPPITPPARQTWKARGVLLEIGHGPNPSGSEPGAVVGRIREYDLNGIAAQAARKVILAAGVPCTITDFGGTTPRNDLYEIGQTAAGFDVFCSIHHNAANASAQGAEVLIHNRKGDATDLALAQSMSAEIAAELGIRDRIARGRDPRVALGVLSGAEDTNVRVSVLAELYFMDAPVTDHTDWSERGGRAVGRAILKWLAANP
ncbi:N-acetylmuramoyl-L-alanine amidase [Pantanalinema rosaneae CENA516]|uniref:N-acetylmuramoyl-L-alanine amidase n=1 Tax=Pantanalinema rosaneae TaxID=1620701 RepID=UPI003D6E9813